MKKRKLIGRLLLVGALCFVFGGTKAFAAESNTSAAKADKAYAIRALLPNNQIDPQVNYWVLQLNPDQRQQLDTQIVNTGRKPITVNVQANDGITADNAKIVYDQKNAQLYPRTTIGFSSLVVGKRAQDVTVEPGHEKTVTFTIKAPPEAYQGIILGGIRTVAKVSDAAKGNITLHQQVEYNLSVVLQGQDTNVTPKLSFGSQVTPGVLANKMVLRVPTINAYQINISGIQTEVKVINRGTKKAVVKNIQYGQSIAPNSRFDWTFSVKKLTAGDYQLQLTVFGRNLKKQTITRNFSISNTLVRRVAAYDQKPAQLNMGVIIMLVVLTIVLLVTAWVLIYFYAVDKGRNKRLSWEKKRKQHK
ncbi:WxL protein peptidoglycan domain-containing protein [Schleiferilactobacillus perolens]|uniref:DUF916 domain-containing protein n=1 Tax=Schleiferilactobacillus perolens TaxID=100468 RepID=UPI0039EC3997